MTKIDQETLNTMVLLKRWFLVSKVFFRISKIYFYFQNHKKMLKIPILETKLHLFLQRKNHLKIYFWKNKFLKTEKKKVRSIWIWNFPRNHRFAWFPLISPYISFTNIKGNQGNRWFRGKFQLLINLSRRILDGFQKNLYFWRGNYPFSSLGSRDYRFSCG